MSNNNIPYKSNAKIYEDKVFVVNAPYNCGKEIFNTSRFNVKVWKENGEDTSFVVIREKENKIEK